MTRPTLIESAPCAPECIVRRARKRWRCHARTPGTGSWSARPKCPNIIAPGEYYIEYVGETPGYQSGERICLSCASSPNGEIGQVVAPTEVAS